VATAIYAPVARAYRVTVEQMALLEPSILRGWEKLPPSD
tara:strand:- start:34 stop:150 length:117 start_codon:yes stop_codon:yes gene_type:complete